MQPLLPVFVSDNIQSEGHGRCHVQVQGIL